MMETCLLPDIWKIVPAAVVQGSTTQEPPPVGCPISVTLPELRQKSRHLYHRAIDLRNKPFLIALQKDD